MGSVLELIEYDPGCRYLRIRLDEQEADGDANDLTSVPMSMSLEIGAPIKSREIPDWLCGDILLGLEWRPNKSNIS